MMSTALLQRLDGITLSSGAHTSFEAGCCVNEAVAWLAGEPHSDRPACMSMLLSSLTMSWNDRLPSNDERDRWLKPLIPVLIGTHTTEADEVTRAYLASDWFVRQRAPAFLRIAGFAAEAETLEGLARIVDAATARAARDEARRVCDSLYKIRAARYNALPKKLSASDAIAAIAASAASAAIDAIAASAASAASADAEGVHAAALRAAVEASRAMAGDKWDKRDAAYEAARKVYDARIAEWPLLAEFRAEVERQKESFAQLIRTLCEVGRAPALEEVAP